MGFIYIWSFFRFYILFLTLIDNKWLWIVFILIIILITITIIITKINQPSSFFTAYGVFQKHTNSEVQKLTTVCVFPCRQSSSSPDLLGNRTLLKRVQKVMVCDLWLVDLWICFVCFCVSRFVACDLTSNNDSLQNSRSFFSKSERNRQSVAYRSLMCAKRANLTHP